LVSNVDFHFTVLIHTVDVDSCVFGGGGAAPKTRAMALPDGGKLTQV